MATVTLLLNHFKEEKSGKMPLYIRIIHRRKPKYISLGIKVHPQNDWNPSRLRVKKSFPNATRINNFIATKVAEAEALAVKLETNSKDVTSQRIKDEIMGKPPGDYIAFADVQIQRLDQAGKARTSTRYKSIISKLKRYLKGKHFTFDDFTVPFLHDYEAHLKSIGNETNTVHTNLKTLRAILYIAIREDRFPQEKNPFFKFKLKKAPTRKERLTEEEIGILAAIQLNSNTNIYHARNAFLFSFYCAGIRIGDLLQLKWKNVATILDYQMGKTQQYRRLKMVRQAQAILDLYRSENNLVNDFIFPFLKNEVDYTDNKFLMKQLSAKTTIVNINLKKLAERTNLNKKLSSHIARHSFADIARKKGMNLYDISKALGHSSLSITEQYLSNFDDNSVDDAMENLFG